MDFETVIRTTGAVREFLPEPVPDAVLYQILDQARFAPSGGNRQGWRIVVVRDRAVRKRLAEIATEPFRLYLAQVAAGEAPWNTINPSKVTPEDVARTRMDFPLLLNLDDPQKVPTLLLLAVDLSVVASIDQHLPRIGVISGASVYPFAWSILLAARNLGYGGVLATFIAPGEAEIRDMVGLPPHFAVCGMIPLGRPVKQVTKLKRKRVEEFASWDRYDGAPVVPGG
jgi:nitroreductase